MTFIPIMSGCKVLTRSKKERKTRRKSKTEKTSTSIMSQFNKFINYCIFTCIFSHLCICIFFLFCQFWSSIPSKLQKDSFLNKYICLLFIYSCIVLTLFNALRASFWLHAPAQGMTNLSPFTVLGK